MTAREDAASDLVRRAAAGQSGEDGKALLFLFKAASDHGRTAESKVAGLEREANALAAVIADLLKAATVDEPLRQIVDLVVDDLPPDARNRVNAYRHQGSAFPGAGAWTSRGDRLPTVPPRVSVMRERLRTIDADVVDVRVEPL